MNHPTADLSDIVHQRVRLGILAVLAEADRAEFTYLRDRLEVTDGNLSRHIQVLAEAGFVDVEKRTDGRSRTWILATGTGRDALAKHLERLQQIIDAAKEAT